MARLILKCPYLKCDGNHSVSGYLRYIGTRERVELLPDDRPPTRKQEQLITKLVKDFPDTRKLDEYSDYETKPTKANASAFISRTLEENWPAVQQSDGYMKYIATRPRAERLGDHGLFGDEDGVDLEQAMDELDQYTGNVWTHIISLKREDAARLGYDNARAWQNLLRANRNDIAAAMNIPPNHFRWYAAYHDEGEHPHVHMMAWSTVPSEAYLTLEGIHKIKSQLTNQIFQQEMLHTYEQKSQSRDELVREARRAIRKLTQEMARSICSHPEIEQKMEQLAGQLETVKGKKSYGYLPKPVKKTVDEIVDKLEELPEVRECYDQWCALQSEVDSYYHDKPREKKKLSWNSQENRTPMSKTLSGKRVIGEASSFDQWREIQFIGSVAPAAVVVGLDPAEYDLANLIPLHGGAVEPVDQFLLQRCEKTLHARVVKAAMRAAHALPDGTEPGEHRPVLLAGVLAAVVGVQYQPLLITIA